MDRDDDKLFNAGQHYGSPGLSGTPPEPLTPEQMKAGVEAYIAAFPKFAVLATVVDRTEVFDRYQAAKEARKQAQADHDKARRLLEAAGDILTEAHYEQVRQAHAWDRLRDKPRYRGLPPGTPFGPRAVKDTPYTRALASGILKDLP